MARVLFNGRWYDEQDPKGYYEAVYENMIKQYASQLWPRFHIASFKFPVTDCNGNTKKADFALIEKDYSEWWIVEVEQMHHSINSHIVPQVRAFSEAKYGTEEAKYLHSTNTSLDLAKLTSLVTSLPPKVLVIVNKPRPTWIKSLQRFNALLGVFELFKSDNGDWLFRVNGEHPVGNAEKISICRFGELMTRWLEVLDPINLRIGNDMSINIEFNGHNTEWTRFDQHNAVYLHTKSGPCPLAEYGDYELCHTGNNRYFLRKLP